MDALLVYSHVTGKRNISKDLTKIKSKLAPSFAKFDFFCAFSKEEAFRVFQSAVNHYDVLIVYGGDGSFNNALNAIMKLDRKPIIGFINAGTIGDVGRNFGIKPSLNSAIKVLRRKNIRSYDVGEALTLSGISIYFAYVATCGAYSDIAYKTKRTFKKRMGKLAYYFKAIKEATSKVLVKYEIILNKRKITGETPFFMVLNGHYIGGFKVNPKGKTNDGVSELYIAKQGLFNGLLHFIPFRRAKSLAISEMEITQPRNVSWCIDGEELKEPVIKIRIHHSAIKVISK